MTLRIYNTLTRRKEEFVPRDPGRVAMYFCGPTPYSHTHIGHLRPALTGDVLARYLKSRGYDVFYLSNFTDIDDKIINAAREQGVQPFDLSARFAAEYLSVMEAMGIDQVDRWVKVTDHIPEIIAMIRTLVDRGFGYPLDGDVYFDVTRMPDYGKLSGRCLDEMQAGARVAVNGRKRHPMDFALWKGAKPGEPAWDSPWGPGRPGWHIECSAMSLKYLGEGFDIHGGGDDLVFPHHENEVAQSECSTGHAPFARYWVHNGMIRINEEKMSKSLGNFITARALLDRFPSAAIRLFMLSTHYRNPLNFSWEAVEDAERAWQRLQNTVADVDGLLAAGGEGAAGGVDRGGDPTAAAELTRAASEARRAFSEAMDDDLNTALAGAALFDLARAVNKGRDTLAQAGRGLHTDDREALAGARDAFVEMGRTLGFRLGEAALAGADRLVRSLIDLVISLREDARHHKEWARSDLIRDRLAEFGVILEDTPQGTRYRLERAPAAQRG